MSTNYILPDNYFKPRVRIRDASFVPVWDEAAEGTADLLTGVPENHPKERLNGTRIYTSRVTRKNETEVETQNTIYDLVKYESQDIYETRKAHGTAPRSAPERLPV